MSSCTQPLTLLANTLLSSFSHTKSFKRENKNRIILKMKRASLSFDHSRATGDGANDKLKYQTLLKEYLELQKEYVSRKRKVQAAKQKRELLLSEVRFLRLKQTSLLKSQAPDADKVPLHTLQGGRNPSTLDQLLLSNSCLNDEAEGGNDHAYEEKVNVRSTKKIKNRHLIRDKGESKRKICLLA